MINQESVIKSQYRAALAMLKDAVESCSRSAHFSKGASVSPPFVKSLSSRRRGGKLKGDYWNTPQIQKPKAQSQNTCSTFCEAQLDEWIDALDLTAPECGFYWYKMTKFEHQFNNLRHLQRHVGQLSDRLRNGVDVGTKWIGGKGE